MTSHLKCMFLLILCMNMAACGMERRAYTHPSIPDADDSEVAIFQDSQFWGALRRIVDADGNEISYLQPSKYPVIYVVRLPPGKYVIYYKYGALASNRVILEAGHKYKVEREECVSIFYLSCGSRMKYESSDGWIQDLTTDKRIAGCRQGLGCIPDSW